MYFTEQKIPLTSTINPLKQLKKWLYHMHCLVNDLVWAYGVLFPDNTAGVKKRAKFVLRTLLNVKASVSWFRFVKGSYLRHALKTEPSLLEVIHRPFFDKNAGACSRAYMLEAHFIMLHSLLGSQQTARIMSGCHIPLFRCFGKNDEHLSIHLKRQDTFKREGGVTLEFCMNNTALLYLSFTMVTTEQGSSIKVGGIQSSKGDCRAQTRKATHALHGIQPRLLLIETLRSIANLINCQQIECVSKENHIHRALRYRLKKSINAEYDQLWLLAGGEQNKKGNFEIPCISEDKPIESKPSNKRSEYRRRVALLESMRTQVYSLTQNNALSPTKKSPNLGSSCVSFKLPAEIEKISRQQHHGGLANIALPTNFTAVDTLTAFRPQSE